MDLNIDQLLQHVKTKQRGSLIVISGPSGVGKGTLVKAILNQFSNLTLSISMTTRTPRSGEVEGKNYFFTPRNDFEALIQESAFLEHATYNQNYYGTPRAFVMEEIQSGRDVILEIDVQGAEQIRNNWTEPVIEIFVLPPSESDLKKRLEKRQTESESVIQQRLDQVAKEVTQLAYYDYYIINDGLEQAIADLASIIQAERLKIKRSMRN